MPKLSKVDEGQLPAVRRSLAELIKVMDALERQVGQTQDSMAGAMRVNQGYLSSLVRGVDQARLSNKKFEQITRGLRLVVDTNQTALRAADAWDGIDDALSQVEAEWGWQPRRLAAPGSVILASHANYIRRPVDADLEGRIGEPGTYLVSGPPQSGRTSLVRRCSAIAAARGVEVAFVDLTAADADDGIGGVCQLIAEAIQPEADVSCRDWEGLDGLLENWLSEATTRGALLVLDGVGTGASDVAFDVMKRIRIWHNRRARATGGSRGWERLAIWVVGSSVDVRETRMLSVALMAKAVGSTSAVDVNWFSPEQVGTLVAAYAATRPPAANGRSEVEVTTSNVRALLDGQPALVHEAIYAWAANGATPKAWAEAGPTAVHTHLQRLAVAIARDDECRRTLAASSGNGMEGWSPTMIELGVFGPDGAWACDLYKQELHRHVELAVARSAEAPIEEGGAR